VIWGGDFNQELRRLSPERAAAGFSMAGTLGGITRLRAAFDEGDLRALTEGAAHRIEGADAIDHLAVSDPLASGAEINVHRRTWREGKRLSDHAAYVAEINL